MQNMRECGLVLCQSWQQLPSETTYCDEGDNHLHANHSQTAAANASRVRAVFDHASAPPEMQMESAQRKAQAINWAQHVLDDCEYSAKTISVIIKAKVRELFNEGREPAPKVLGPARSDARS